MEGVGLDQLKEVGTKAVGEEETPSGVEVPEERTAEAMKMPKLYEPEEGVDVVGTEAKLKQQSARAERARAAAEATHTSPEALRQTVEMALRYMRNNAVDKAGNPIVDEVMQNRLRRGLGVLSAFYRGVKGHMPWRAYDTEAASIVAQLRRQLQKAKPASWESMERIPEMRDLDRRIYEGGVTKEVNLILQQRMKPQSVLGRGIELALARGERVPEKNLRSILGGEQAEPYAYEAKKSGRAEYGPSEIVYSKSDIAKAEAALKTATPEQRAVGREQFIKNYLEERGTGLLSRGPAVKPSTPLVTPRAGAYSPRAIKDYFVKKGRRLSKIRNKRAFNNIKTDFTRIATRKFDHLASEASKMPVSERANYINQMRTQVKNLLEDVRKFTDENVAVIRERVTADEMVERAMRGKGKRRGAPATVIKRGGKTPKATPQTSQEVVREEPLTTENWDRHLTDLIVTASELGMPITGRMKQHLGRYAPQKSAEKRVAKVKAAQPKPAEPAPRKEEGAAPRPPAERLFHPEVMNVADRVITPEGKQRLIPEEHMAVRKANSDEWEMFPLGNIEKAFAAEPGQALEFFKDIVEVRVRAADLVDKEGKIIHPWLTSGEFYAQAEARGREIARQYSSYEINEE